MPDNLPVLPADAEIDEGIVDGEIVEETAAPRPVIVQVFASITVVVQHPVPRAAGRHAGHIAAGTVVLWRRRRQGRTLAQRMARQAEMAGDHVNAALWHDREASERHRRHERRVAVAEVVISLAKASPWIIGATAGCMLALGILLAIATRSMSMAVWPFTTAARIAADLVTAVSATWLIVVFAAAAGFVLYLYLTGRNAGDLAPGWSAAAKRVSEDRGLVVTADTIVLALANLPVTALKSARKGGWKPSFTTMPVRDGRGYSAVFSLPLGVTPDMIADQRPVLARNLHREEIEVWPSAGPPGFASLWVADRGAISKAAPEYPLLHEGQADVFEGVPGGVIARGDDVLIPVVGNNGVLGGMMGQGKSNAGRVVFLGACLDPLAELDVFVFANNGDFDAYAPRLARYVKGTEDDTAEAAVSRLHELYEEVGRREGRLAGLGAKKVTRGLAQANPDMRPVIALFSECHELFGHPEYGEIAAELAVKTIKRARKTAITLWFDTQSSRKEAIPPRLVELVSVNCCFAVKTWRSNDGFLGDGSFAAGIRATELRPGRDRGTSLVTGVSDAQFELVKWYYIPVDDDTGYDAAAEVIARAMKNLAPGTAVAGNSPLPAIEVHDLLSDLDEVIEGPDRVRLADLPARLRKLSPAWLPYRGLDGVQLRKLLDESGVRTVNPGNVPTLDPAELRRVLAERDDEVS